MKKYYYTLGITALTLALVIPTFARAEDGQSNDTSGSINASMQMQGEPGPVPGSIRDRIRTDIEMHNANIVNNRDIRNNTLEVRMGVMASTSSSTPPHFPPPRDRNGEDGPGNPHFPGPMGTSTPPGIHGHNDQGDRDTENASSTDRDGHEDTKNMLRVRKDVFLMQKTHLVDELNRALNNLSQVRGRIADRITKAEANGHSMTDAKALLVTADAKISAARLAIDALINLNPPATTTVSASTTASTTTPGPVIDLGQPRKVGAAAIEAVKNAQRALNAVVVSIAHSMGFKIDGDGRIEATTTASTTSP